MSALPPPRFNPFDSEFRQDPYRVYAHLRVAAPIHRSLGMWVLTRYADVLAVLKDPHFSSSQIPLAVRQRSERPDQAQSHPLARLAAKSIVFTDEPDHTRLRHLVVRAIKRRTPEQEQAHLTRIASALLERVGPKGRMDAVADYAERLPLQFMAESMALPPDSWQTVRDWTHQLRYLLEPGLMGRGDFERVQAVLDEVIAFFEDMLAVRRQQPGDDLISALDAAHREAQADRLSDEEIVYCCIMMFVAGHETTRSLIASGLLALLQHPEQLAYLRMHPERMGAAVTEMLRYESPLQQTKRRATAAVAVGGRTIQPQEQVLLCLGAANRDPARFEQPDRFDITRTDNGHLAFGQGMHHCLGAALAQMEAQVALRVLLERFANLTLQDTPEWLEHSFILRGLKTLPVQWDR
ncbi:cytochrome P450 [Gloeobacter violaceus]|uniref:Cytochrome P450 like protein n=1 Tax=Gloeobacter violaceus (strain ATCC 29082 / PCC 7421) TaxID=251221 RepID=Q7NJ97_GLOVI|nr:cytochrome P450 [Gloeobacter violaceus]BAC89876.1 cytochrome P450 like protein [Gloeobacter violaceus PCC 7421]